ncbi:ISAs1 family transposase (plasmid) [Runella rosea]|uniref:ISAs1 family transposase n=2 Tax=Runella rosea TaxID=2259595 RepID=A0A344TTL7_9BACT|nr:ISAs1 family transposase [Runella rosea]
MTNTACPAKITTFFQLLEQTPDLDMRNNRGVNWFERSKSCLKTDISRDLAHGRAEKRTIMVSEKLDFIDTAQEWVGLNSIIYVESSRWVNRKEQHSKRYYISSLSGCSAAQMGYYIRLHWSIENEQHWHLDVTFDEDGCQVRGS